jgi:hypothetical protein
MRRWLTWWGGVAAGLLVAWGAVALVAGDGTAHPADHAVVVTMDVSTATRVEVRSGTTPQDARRVVPVPRSDRVRATAGTAPSVTVEGRSGGADPVEELAAPRRAAVVRE